MQSYQYLNGYQLYGFIDAGLAWNDGYRPSDGLSLTSAGAGIRLFLTEGLQADIGDAAPLSYRAPDNPGRGCGGAVLTLKRAEALSRADDDTLFVIRRHSFASNEFGRRVFC